MRLPRIVYAFMLALAPAIVQPGVARAAAPPRVEEETTPQLSPQQQAGLALIHALIHNPWRNVPVPPAPDNPAPLDVKPQEVNPNPDPGPSDPPVIIQEAPEPASLTTLLIGGSVGVGAWIRNRRRKPKTD